MVYPVLLLQRVPTYCEISYSIREEISEINRTLDSIIVLAKKLLEKIPTTEDPDDR